MQVIYHVSIQRAVEELEKTALEKFVANEMNITVRQSRQSGVARATCPD